MENVLRALDDDTHAPVLTNPSVTRDAFATSGFPARHWAVVFVFFSPQQTLVELKLTSVLGSILSIEVAPVASGVAEEKMLRLLACLFQSFEGAWCGDDMAERK